MRILIVHNHYGSTAPSGENKVVEAEKKLLQDHGHIVEEFSRNSDLIRGAGITGTLRGAISTPWNPWVARVLARTVDQFLPDVVHVHNTFPLISPLIFHALRGKVARVMTMHNYRLVCPAAIPLRDGKVCVECLEKKSSLPSLRHGCYRDSRIATLPLAASVSLHRVAGTWKSEVETFIALSEFQRNLMGESGIPIEKIRVKPNFYPGTPPLRPWQERRPYVVFAGRLTAEKGVENLIKAWKIWGEAAPELRMIGEGGLLVKLKKMAEGLPVRFLGQLSSVETQNEIASARLLVLPSEWFEGFPMVVREAFAFGTPPAVSDIGPLPFLVEHNRNGLVFQPANPLSITNTIRLAWETPDLLRRLGEGARQEFETKYTEEVNYSQLMRIYEHSILALSDKKKFVEERVLR